LIGEGDELFGQAVEPPEIFHVLLDPLGLSRTNALGTLLALEGTLQDEVGTGLDDFAIPTGFEELAAESAAPQVVDLFHAIEHVVALATESLDGVRHGCMYLYGYK